MCFKASLKDNWISTLASRQQSLRKSLFSLLGFSVLVIILLTSVTVLLFVYQTEKKAWQGRQGEAALRAADTVSAFLHEIEDHLFLVDMLEPDYLETQPQTLARQLDRNQAALEIVRLNKKGEVLASEFRDIALLTNLFTISQASWFSEASQGRFYLSDVQISSVDAPYLIMAIPASDGGVVAARVSMRVLWDVVADIRFGETGTAYVINQEGRIVGHTDSQIPLANVSLAGRPEMDAIWAAPDFEWYGKYENFAGTPVVSTTRRIPGTNWVVVTELPQAEAFAVSRTAWIALGGGMLLIATLVYLAAGRFLRYLIIQPMEALRAGVMRIGQGDLSHQIDSGRQDEIGQVARAFNEMAKSLRERDEQLALQTKSLLVEVDERKLAQDALQQARDLLEIRVKNRTVDLANSNEALQIEVKERERAEKQIRNALHEKVVLLKEIHHRVKNNLQVIASMLNLQSGYIEDQQSLEIFQDSQNRVEAMAAIHEKLYQSENLARIDFADYIRDLTASLFSTYENRGTGVELSVEADDAWLGVDTAVPCGLILNELVSNALKHAFPDGHGGQLKIQFLNMPDGKLSLCVADNGIGFPPQIDFRNTTSLGLQLVNTLVNQLDGTLDLKNEQGTTFQLAFFSPPEGTSQ